MKIDYQNKAQGMLVGLAVGDALGAPVEFLPEPSSVHIREMGAEIEHFRENLRLPKGVWTDDTEMALCIADSLIVEQGYNSYDIMQRFSNWINEGYRTYDSKPAVDVGLQTMRAIEEFERYPVISEHNTTDSAGNGAIMRLAPIIIANLGAQSSIEETVKMAVFSCRETHNSEMAEFVTRIFAEILYKICNGASKDEIMKFVDSKMELEKNGERLRDLGGYIVDTLAISLWGLVNFENFRDGMLAVIRLGGDTDTNGACYGQLAGAYYGYETIPEEWRNEVYLSDELVETANNLLNMSRCPILKTRFEDDEHFVES